MNAFKAPGALTSLYPEVPGLVAHSLVDHSLFALDAIFELAGRLRPADIEYNRGNLSIGVDESEVIGNGLSIAETIRSIRENESWMVLKFVEQDPPYGALLHDMLVELETVVKPMTGDMLHPQAFIFISSPNAITPFHFDPEHNILLQLSGTKTITVCPANDETIVPGSEHERFHTGGHRNLSWHDDFARNGQCFDLKPGDGIYVPVKAPHWVRNGPDVSVSFSITWRSEWSYREADVRGFNALLRMAGFNPNPPRRFPHNNQAKSLAYRLLRRPKPR